MLPSVTVMPNANSLAFAKTLMFCLTVVRSSVQVVPARTIRLSSTNVGPSDPGQVTSATAALGAPIAMPATSATAVTSFLMMPLFPRAPARACSLRVLAWRPP
jgi:hypothetical protein